MTIADLHIHSKYSRATSKDGDPEHLDFWARRKGIGLLGTGDFTHPAWREELHEKLVPAEEGLYVLKEEYRLPDELLSSGRAPRFVVSGEISSIYKQDGKTRKVHNVILLPGLEEADTLSHKLEAIGNIHSDGRPILGLSSHDLLEITLETCPRAIFIPAHIWTPHFSLFGAFSGFDTIEECFGDLTPYIHALETGLSSDPPMNWRVSALDRFTLVSHSDAHSPQKLGREANLLSIELSYPALAKALQTGEGFLGTVEFFPEEGKYHYDGHRNCGVCLKPEETLQYGGRCPVCGKKITIGVQHRVEELADRPEGYRRPNAPAFESLAPLPEVIAASTGLSAGGKKTAAKYEALLRELGPEFPILREISLEEIGRVAGPCVQEGVRRLRLGQVVRIPGFDGEYGTIRLLDDSEIRALEGQTSFFIAHAPAATKKQLPDRKAVLPEAAGEISPALPLEDTGETGALVGLNPQQKAAVTAEKSPVCVIAGPGTGKTKTLVSRIAYLLEKGVTPKEITAVTFTNKAAGELTERLQKQFGKRAVKGMTVGTFHAICLELLQNAGQKVMLAGEYEAFDIAAKLVKELSLSLSPRQFLQEVSAFKNGKETALAPGAVERYNEELASAGMLDFDDLLLSALSLWEEGGTPAGDKRFTHLLVDEFQDINAVQYRLIRAWAKAGKDLFVIGDPDQSIYGFRGSDPGCFAKLSEDFPQGETVRLIKNYRSTPEILRCALPVISHNPGGERLLDPVCPSGLPVRELTATTPLSEGIAVAKEISRLIGGMDMLDAQGASRSEKRHFDFSDFAILYRTHRQGEVLEKCLRTESIPYVVAGREDFLDDAVVRGILCFFRFLVEPRDLFSLSCALKLVWEFPPDLTESVCTSLSGRTEEPKKAAEFLRSTFEQDGRVSLWLPAWEALFPRAKKETPRKLLEAFLPLAGLSPEQPAIQKLLNMAVFSRDLPSFLQALTLGQESDLMRSSGGKTYASGTVTLMTLHGSKGLEFPVVFLCGVNQGVLPLESPRHPCDTEEERRLFFVGMTRAKQELILLTSGHESPFLKEIPPEALQVAPASSHASKPQQLSLF